VSVEEPAKTPAAGEPAAAAPPEVERAGPPARGTSWLPWAFGFLCLLHLAPIWSVTYLPTVDGPSHLYNSWILRHIGDTEHYPQLAENYQVVLRPVPNWFCYAVTWLLLFAVPPLVAEKLLVSAIILLWLLGFWYLAGAVERERQWLAFVGFALVFNMLFQFGFWNFCFSVGFYMLAVGYWWRRRRQPDLRTALTLNGILLLCYFSHILSTELALFSIGVLWLCTCERRGWRRHLRHVALLAPQALLPLWFMLSRSGGVVAGALPAQQLLRYFFHFEWLLAFRHTSQINDWVALVFALLVALAAVDRVRRWRAPDGPGESGRPRGRLVRQEDGFLLLAVLLAVIYLLAPEGVAGGSIIKPRLALFPYLALLPWMSVHLAARARLVAVAVLATLGLVNAWNAWSCYGQMDPILTACVHTLDKVAPRSRVLPLYFDHPGFCVRLGVLGHTIDYAAIDKGLIDLDNYEAATDLFPVRFTPRLAKGRPGTYVLEAAPGDLRVHRYLHLADYIFSWAMPEDAPVRGRILHYYDQIFALGPVRLFARQAGAS
jgi:hypothetical protein